jgi:hypothetical protein
MVVDHPLREGLDVGIRRSLEGHTTELYRRNILQGDIAHELTVAQVRTGPARAYRARRSPGLFRCGRLRAV